jgi:predicted Zn-dependent peptidase
MTHGMRVPHMADRACNAGTSVTTLANGVRVVVLRMPYLATVAVSVFVRSGSQHESARLGGISHFIEHMAFKGTRSRDCQQINLDAERLGAEVNAHTDKNHTAFHMRGLARDAGSFLHMLGDIVRHSTFPEAELERERQVILHEYTEDEDDALSTAFRLFDKACYGRHALARPVIGSRANIRRFTRTELVAYVQQQYTGANTVVGIAGNVDADQVVGEALAAFGDMPRGCDNRVAAPDYVGGIRARRLPGCSQAHVVIGFPIPGLLCDYHGAAVAAALFGEGMSSPLLDEVRERRGLVYHADCSADVTDLCGQFVIEATTMPEHIDEYFAEVSRLLREHTESTDPVGLERARNQIMVRSLCAQEVPSQRLEFAALDLFAFGRARSREELMASVAAVTPTQVREAFVRMLGAGAAVALAGSLPKGVEERAAQLVARRDGGSPTPH